jgi:twitching motility protein PilI
MARAGKLDLRVFQQELAARLASKTAAQVESSRLSFACAGRQWLIRLPDAGEVIPLPHIATVPHTKSWFLGICNIRGNLYSIVDLAGYLGHDNGVTPAGAPGNRLVVFGPRTGDLKACIAVERVLGLRNLAELAPASAPNDAPPWYGHRWMDADGGAWQEIDLARLAKDPEFLQVGR